MTKPDIQIPASFAIDGIKTDFDNTKIQNGFDRLQPDVLAGDNLNKFIDDTYKGLNGVLDLYKGAVLYDVNETYSNKSIIFNIDENNEIKIYRSLVNNNIGNDLDDTDYWEEVKLGGGSAELCDIGIALFVDESKGLRRYLNGTTVTITTQTTPFLNRLKEIVALYPSLSCTEAQWQSIASSSVGGQCGKFVINETAGTIRLPKIIMPIQGLTNLANLGQLVQAGLPNITGSHTGSSTYSDIADATNYSGAMYCTTATLYEGMNSTIQGTHVRNEYFDASRSNDIYGNSTTVQQEQIQYPYFIQIATGQETESEISNTLELNNPFSMFDCKYTDKTLSNLSWLKSSGQWNNKSVYVKAYECLQVEYNTSIVVGEEVTLPSGTSYIKQGLSVKLSTATYTDYDFVLNTTAETFRLPTKSKLASGNAVVGNGKILGLVGASLDSNKYGYILSGTSGDNNAFLEQTSTKNVNAGSLPSNRSNWASTSSVGLSTNSSVSGVETDTTGLNLYFYVGETVQNANIINAGRIEETKANKTDVDGQWTKHYATIASSVAFTTTDKNYDLSSHLPNDGYAYEVMLYGWCRTSSTSGDRVILGFDTVINSNGDTVYTCICGTQTRSTSTMTGYGSGIVPMYNRTLTVAGITNPNGEYTLNMQGYRRIGTNQ